MKDGPGGSQTDLTKALRQINKAGDSGGPGTLVPAGRLVRDLGCKIEWSGESCRLVHPTKGNIEVNIENGCPQLSHEVSLELIRELEEARSRQLSLPTASGNLTQMWIGWRG